MATTGVLLNWGAIYFERATDAPNDATRLWLAVPVIFLSLGIRAFRYRNDPGPPWIAYVRYVIYLSGLALVFFVASHSFLNLDNWLYYWTSGAVIFFFSQTDGMPVTVSRVLYAMFGLEYQNDEEARVSQVVHAYLAAANSGKTSGIDGLIKAGAGTLKSDPEVDSVITKIGQHGRREGPSLQERLRHVSKVQFFEAMLERNIQGFDNQKVEALLKEFRDHR